MTLSKFISPINEKFDLLFIFSCMIFFSSAVVKGEKESKKYLFIDFIGSSILIAALSETIPSFIKIIS